MAARHLLSSHLGALVAASTAGLRQQSSGMYIHIDRLAEAACSLVYVELGRRQLHTPSAGISHMTSLRAGKLSNLVNFFLKTAWNDILISIFIINASITNN
jgi:hypothetical protein